MFRTNVFASRGDDDRTSVELKANLLPGPVYVTDKSLTPTLFEQSPPIMLHFGQSLFNTGEMKEFVRYAELFFSFVVNLKISPY